MKSDIILALLALFSVIAIPLVAVALSILCPSCEYSHLRSKLEQNGFTVIEGDIPPRSSWRVIYVYTLDDIIKLAKSFNVTVLYLRSHPISVKFHYGDTLYIYERNISS